MKPQTPVIESAREQQEKLAIKAVMLPVVLGAVMTPASHALQLQRAGTPVMGAGAFGLMKQSLNILPTVTSKQATRSAAGFATPKKSEEGNSSLYPAALAVSLETGFSGFNGMMAGLSTGKIVKPKNISVLGKLAWNTKIVAQHTPHTGGYTGLASAVNVAGMALIGPKVSQHSKQIVSNPHAQTIIGITAASVGVSLLTTPINTLGGRYLKSLDIQQKDRTLTITPKETFTQTVKDAFKGGVTQGAKTLYKPLPLTVGMTWLAYIAFHAADHAVEPIYNCKQAFFGLVEQPAAQKVEQPTAQKAEKPVAQETKAPSLGS